MNRATVLLSIGLQLSCAVREASVGDVTSLPTYTQRAAAVFDDSVSLTAFGISASIEPQADPRLAKAIAEADLIIPARLETVGIDDDSQGTRYELTLRLTGDPLRGELPSDVLELNVGRTSPSQAMLRTMATQVVGQSLVVLIRRFQREGEMVLHFRAESDTPAVRETVALASQSQE